MIAIPFIRSSFGRVAGYNQKNCRELGGKLIFSNVASTDAFQMEREFNAVAAVRPKARKCGVHLVVAVHPDDTSKATAFRFVKWLLRIRDFMGFGQSQIVAWQHFDKKHPHIHVLMNRVPLEGPAIRVWGRKKALREFCAQLAKKEGLRVASEREFRLDHGDEFGTRAEAPAEDVPDPIRNAPWGPDDLHVKQLSSCQEDWGNSELRNRRVLEIERIRSPEAPSEPDERPSKHVLSTFGKL